MSWICTDFIFVGFYVSIIFKYDWRIYFKTSGLTCMMGIYISRNDKLNKQNSWRSRIIVCVQFSSVQPLSYVRLFVTRCVCVYAHIICVCKNSMSSTWKKTFFLKFRKLSFNIAVWILVTVNRHKNINILVLFILVKACLTLLLPLASDPFSYSPLIQTTEKQFLECASVWRFFQAGL